MSQRPVPTEIYLHVSYNYTLKCSSTGTDLLALRRFFHLYVH